MNFKTTKLEQHRLHSDCYCLDTKIQTQKTGNQSYNLKDECCKFTTTSISDSTKSEK